MCACISWLDVTNFRYIMFILFRTSNNKISKTFMEFEQVNISQLSVYLLRYFSLIYLFGILQRNFVELH